ncbi:MAG: restriction endonuclease subunit S, partial [Planktothrix sp.]|uniref:restriction endonuclease subunit S n=1 Tax=Planktothrix sp. TaxID=3088171 RepID=UPI0038D363AF
MSKYQSSNIYEISLADALEFVVDNRGKTVPTDDKGIALIATNCISNDHIYPQKQNLRYVSQDIFDNWFRAHPKPGDIILTNKGSNNGEVCLVPNTVDFCIAQDMVAVRADKKKIDPLYLFAALRSRIVQKRIKYLNVDAVIPHFKKTDFNKLLIPLPDRKSQEFIGKIYFNFSIKIDNLRRQNETLETIAQTLFKHWFIDFEFPNDDGKPYKSSGGAMVASELGDIPAGWRVGKIEEIAKRIGMGPFGSRITTDNFVDNGIPVIRGNNLTNGFNEDGFVYLTPEKADELKSSNVFPEDLVFTHRGTLGQVGFIPTSSQYPRYVVSQSQMFLSVNKSLMSPRFIYRFFCSKPGLNALLANKNTTGVPSIASPSTSLRAIKILIPNIKLMQNFDLVITAIDFKKDGNKKQIETLTKTRDTLLPKLMSGQIRV